MADVAVFSLMVAGAAEENTPVLVVRNPYSGEILAEVATADAAMVALALDNAADFFADRENWLSVPERIAVLEKMVTLLTAQAGALARGAAAEGGKPLVDSDIEMARCIESVRICIDVLRTHAPAAVPMGCNAASEHRLTMMMQSPIGVVVAISAFNHPLNLIAHQVAPAIAAGCPVIVKPAEDTPLSCARLVALFHQAGVPLAACQMVVPTSHALVEQLATDARVAFLSFIGSAKVGWYLRSKLAAGTRCALEHGGVAPVIVAADANITRALPGLVKAAFYHAGQVCVSVQRVFVARAIARELADKLAEAAQHLVVGDPSDSTTDIGPLIRAAEVVRVDAWVQAAIEAGAECLTGGRSLPNQSYAPTVLYAPDAASKVMTQELFGPVVCVVPFDTVDAAIAAANSVPFAFQAAVYTQDIDSAVAISQQLDASAVMINDHTAFRVDWMPFAGLKQSGLGVGGIPHTMAEMQNEKMVVVKSAGL